MKKYNNMFGLFISLGNFCCIDEHFANRFVQEVWFCAKPTKKFVTFLFPRNNNNNDNHNLTKILQLRTLAKTLLVYKNSVLKIRSRELYCSICSTFHSRTFITYIKSDKLDTLIANTWLVSVWKKIVNYKTYRKLSISIIKNRWSNL